MNTTVEDLNRGEVARESIAGWLRYSRRAKGILTVAAKLRQEQHVTKNDWEWLFDGVTADKNERPFDALRRMRKEDSLAANHLIAVLAAHPRNTIAQQKRTVALTVNHWLDECQAGVSIEWEGSGVDFRIGRSDPLGRGTSVLIAIGVQLLRAVLRQENFVWCSACGSPYAPKRQPRAGENHYCEECGRSTAVRMAQRRFQKRRTMETSKGGEDE